MTGILSRRLGLSGDYIPVPSVFLHLSLSLSKDDDDGDSGEQHFPPSRPLQEFSASSAGGDRKFAGMMSSRWKLQRVSRIIRYRCRDEINFLAQHF